jgi:hypothetical protein
MGDRDFRDQRANEPAGVIKMDRFQAPPSLVFLRPRLRVVVQEFSPHTHSHRQTHLHWSPRIQLQSIESLIAERQRIIQQIESRAHIRELRRTERLVIRTSSRFLRIERSQFSRSSPGVAHTDANRWSPSKAQMVLRSTPEVRTESQHTPAQTKTALPAMAVTQPLDVARLTEQVIHTLDRRFQAWRERTGRT